MEAKNTLIKTAAEKRTEKIAQREAQNLRNLQHMIDDTMKEIKRIKKEQSENRLLNLEVFLIETRKELSAFKKAIKKNASKI